MRKNFFPLGDYVTINISSPNTKGLREFHNKELLHKLLSNINKIRIESNFKKSFLLKISPDIEDSFIDSIIELSLQYQINGLILTNSSDGNRENLIDKNKNETGGLSGKPLRDLSNNLIKKFYKKLNGKLPIIGVGGIDSGKSALKKFPQVLQQYNSILE